VTAEKRARSLFNSIISRSVIIADEFYDEYWKQQPLIITKNNNDDNNGQDSTTNDTDKNFHQTNAIEKFANNFYEQYLDLKHKKEETHKKHKNRDVDNEKLLTTKEKGG